MEWGILVIILIFIVVAYVVVQGTRASMAWRRAADAGDLDVIRQLLKDSIRGWCSMKRPEEVAPDVWRGVQSVDLIDVGPDSARVSCQVESEYRLVDERWVEVANVLEEGMAVTVRLADMLLYDVPNLHLASACIDVYTSFRDPEGGSRRACILTTTARREVARRVDWEASTPADIIDALGGRYRRGERGDALPIEIEDEIETPELHALGVQTQP
jgi:hypothetical protein